MVTAAGWKVRLIEPDGSLSQITEKRGQADALDLGYGITVDSKGPGWELCERVLPRLDVVEPLSEGW